MTIQQGDTLPPTTFMTLTEEGPQSIESESYFAGRRIALFSVPGAYTPTCSARHLPGYIDQLDALKDKGIDEVACTAVNDPFVIGNWGKSAGADGKVTMLADGNGAFVKAIGLDADMSKFNLGTRGRRFSMIVNDGVVEQLNVEEPGDFNVSSADHMLGTL